MPIKKYKPLSPDPFINKIKGDTEFARLAHLNNLVDQVNEEINNIVPPGGGGTNPTSEYIPYNDAGTFADSYLQNINQPIDKYLRATYGTAVGLDINFGAEFYVLGDIDNPLPNLQGGFIVNSGQVSTKSAGSYFGFTSGSTDMTIGDYLGGANNTILKVDDANSTIKTAYGGNDLGVKCDFANDIYSFGKTNFGYTQIGNTACYFGDHSGSFNNNVLILDDFNGTLQTYYSGGGFGLSFNYTNLLFTIGDYGYSNAGTSIAVDDTNKIIKTQYGGNDIGLNMNFSTGDLILGDNGGYLGLGAYIYINALTGQEQIGLTAGTHQWFFAEQSSNTGYVGSYSSMFYFTEGSSLSIFDQSTGTNNGFELNYTTSLSSVDSLKLGDFANWNGGVYIDIDFPGRVIQTKTSGGVIQGFSLNSNSNEYQFGYINDNVDETKIAVFDGEILTKWHGLFRGFDMVMSDQTYQFGSLGASPNFYLEVSNEQTNPFQHLRLTRNNQTDGLNIDFVNNLYQFGNLYTSVNGFYQTSIGNITDGVYMDITGDSSGGTCIMKAIDALSGQDILFHYENDGNEQYFKFGYFAGNQNYIIMGSDNGQDMIMNTVINGSGKGFELNGTANNYIFGDTGTEYLFVDGGSSETTVFTQRFKLNDQGSGNLLSGTAGGNSGQHLVITINGTDYKIALLNS